MRESTTGTSERGNANQRYLAQKGQENEIRQVDLEIDESEESVSRPGIYVLYDIMCKTFQLDWETRININ